MRTIFSILFLPIFVLSQEVLIKQLNDNVNTNNAELNFIQTNDTTAYFTVIKIAEGKFESSIFKTTFANGYWNKKKYSKYNSDKFNVGNIFFSNNDRIFFTRCNSEMLDCKIIYFEGDDKSTIQEIIPIYSEGVITTQPFVIQHKSHKALYFVSDRKGGFGGLDIWVSIIDQNGNFGIPINAGININSINDDITPFYNHHDGMLYFSSNRKSSKGGFDIYKAEGSLNIWREAKNIEEMNTNQDELYLNFYNEKRGYFTSNRDGAKFQNTEYCCNDIFYFEYPSSQKTDTITRAKRIQDYLPLNLYFHNDEPDPNTMRTTTQKTYKETYASYFIRRSDYEKNNKNSSMFFEEILLKNFNTLNTVLGILLVDLKNGNKMELQIRGYASPLHNHDYNQNLSQRRISSFINYLEQFKSGSLKDYIYSKKLIITKLPFGESNASNKVSDDSNDKKKSVYSIGAMLERKIEIVDVISQE